MCNAFLCEQSDHRSSDTDDMTQDSPLRWPSLAAECSRRLLFRLDALNPNLENSFTQSSLHPYCALCVDTTADVLVNDLTDAVLMAELKNNTVSSFDEHLSCAVVSAQKKRSNLWFLSSFFLFCSIDIGMPSDGICQFESAYCHEEFKSRRIKKRKEKRKRKELVHCRLVTTASSN